METDSLTPCWVQFLYRLHPSRTPQESWYHLQSSCSQLGEIQPPSPTNQSSPSRWAISSQEKMVPQSGQTVNQTACDCSWCRQFQTVASPPMCFEFFLYFLVAHWYRIKRIFFSKRFQFPLYRIWALSGNRTRTSFLLPNRESLLLLPINVASWSFCSIGQCETKAVRYIQGMGMSRDACYHRRRAKVKLEAVKEESAKNEAAWSVVVQQPRAKSLLQVLPFLKPHDGQRPKRKYKNRSKNCT